MAARVHDMVVTIATDTTKSQAVEIPDWATYAKLYVPALDANGAVTCEVYVQDGDNVANATTMAASSDTNWVQVLDSAESNQLVGSGVEQVWVDISEYIRGFPSASYFRVVCAGVQVGNVTFKIAFYRD